MKKYIDISDCLNSSRVQAIVEGRCALAESERRTLLDPLAAALLLARPRVGMMQTVAFITNDVALNGWVGGTRGFQVGAFAAQSCGAHVRDGLKHTLRIEYSA